MATPPVPEAISELLAKPNASVIATVRSDGQPVTVVTWYLWDSGRVLVNMDESRKRLAYLRANPRVSLTVLAPESWYSHVSLQGRVTEFVEDTGLADVDRLATHYTGKPYPVRDRRRISAWVDVDRWHVWGDIRHAE